ncbi:MAG TPA: uroporphyrinogen-III synthase [Verrucomicrobiae bacterium]|nr:uroporphyrinogen-III synthase [Verrucomicrobiae bacterium]
MSFAGLRVLSLESRRSMEMAELIRKQDGDPVVAPAMREVPLDDSGVLEFAQRLFAGEFDMMLLLTGVGTRQLNRAIAEHFSSTAFADALARLTIAVRGPKPVAALRELGLTPAIVAPEPNTWRELLAAVDGRPERRIAVQEYGRPNLELLDGLRRRGVEVTSVRIYRYGLPENSAPLREAARRLAAGEIPIALFTTAAQIENLAAVARDEGIENEVLQALRRSRVMSIGPSTTEALQEFGVKAEFEPSHPKMGLLVREAAERISAHST